VRAPLGLTWQVTTQEGENVIWYSVKLSDIVNILRARLLERSSSLASTDGATRGTPRRAGRATPHPCENKPTLDLMAAQRDATHAL